MKPYTNKFPCTKSLPIYSYHIDTNIRYSCFRLRLRWGDLEGYYDEKVFARIDEGGNEGLVIRYQYDNHLGSACLELDEYANIISYEEYHPFGTTSYRSGRDVAEVSLKRYKYCGKERDEETGLYYYGMRYYAAWLCRFVSVDPLQFEYPYYTPYQYAGNKPITYIDLDGGEEMKPEEQVETSNNTLLNKNADIQHRSSEAEKLDSVAAQDSVIEELPFSIVLKQSLSLKSIIRLGEEWSTTFSDLLKQNNITENNYSNVISYGRKTLTSDGAKITLSRREIKTVDAAKLAIIELSHELTNLKNKASIKKLDIQVSQGVISSAVYANAYAKIEIDGNINQIKVAAELNYTYKSGYHNLSDDKIANLNSIVQKYRKNPDIEWNKYIRPSQEHIKTYVKQGRELREYYEKFNK